MIRPTYLFTGDRKWGDSYIVDVLLSGLYLINKQTGENPIVVHGAAKGLDSIAQNKAALLGMTEHGYQAQWDQFGKSAGPRRNRLILAEEDVNVCFAFHDDLEQSKGTKDMVERAVLSGIPTYVIKHA